MKLGEIKFDWGKTMLYMQRKNAFQKLKLSISFWNTISLSTLTNLDGLVRLLVDETNLYVQQNGRKFRTNKKEMRALLGISYIMSISKLPTIKSC